MLEGKALTFPLTPQPTINFGECNDIMKKFRKYGYSGISGDMGLKGSALAYEIDEKSSDVFKIENVKKCKICKKKIVKKL